MSAIGKTGAVSVVNTDTALSDDSWEFVDKPAEDAIKSLQRTYRAPKSIRPLYARNIELYGEDEADADWEVLNYESVVILQRKYKRKYTRELRELKEKQAFNEMQKMERAPLRRSRNPQELVSYDEILAMRAQEEDKEAGIPDFTSDEIQAEAAAAREASRREQEALRC